ncbi:hypothetical protein MPSEU_001006100 [Mayamaea pseudoterrestris]|nr:hypothetical protein MPSEU_001006100 [Mayamaea pseudoterrestris]
MDPIITREIQDETCKQDHKSGNEEAHATTAAPAAESLCDSLPPLQNFDPAVQADNNLRWQPVESRSEHLIDKPCKELTARRIDFNHAMFDPPIISRVVSRDKDEDDIMIDQNGSNDDDLIISLLNVSDYDQLFRSMHEYNDDDETVAGKVSLDEALIFQELAFDDDASKQHDDCDDSNKPLQSITCGGKYLHESPISCASSLSIYNTHNDDDGDAASSTTLPFASTSMEQFLLNFECQLDETVHDLRQTMQQQEDEQRQQFNVKRQKASMLITTFMKRHRSSVHRVKHDQYLELANASMAWRKKWERDTSSCRMHDAAAIKIQSVVRGQASRRRTSMLLHEIKRELAQSDFSSTLLLQEISAEMTYSDSREAARLIQTILRRYKVKQTAGRRQRVQHETIADTPPRLIKSRNNVSSSSAAFVNDSPARRLIQTMLASTRISNVWRQSLNERHHEEESAVAAASVIQCAVRRWLATKKLVPLQEEQTRRGEELRQQSHRVAAANLLARIWSGFATRRRFLCSRKASVKLQQGWRMHRARQLYIRRQRSSTMLQNLLRCYLSRRKLLAAVQKMKLDRAVTLVARQWRRFVTRKKFAANIKALVTMQRAIRLHQLKMAGTTVRVARAAREKAASKLQATWRRRECRQVNSKQTNPPENRKIVTIQSIIRRYHARGTYVNLHDLRFEISAVRIASFWRHVVNRRRYNAMRYAALILQRHLRKCMMTRLKVSPIASSANLQVSSPLLPSSLAIQVTSAGKMQRIVRQFLARKHAATHIQRAYISSPMKRQQARKLLLEASSFFKANWRSKYNYKFNSPVRCTALSSHESLQTLDNASAVKAIIVLQTKSTQIQAAWRKALACIPYALVRKSVILCQSVARLFIARQKLETSSNSSLKHNLNGCHELIEVQDKRNICIIKRNLNASAVKCIQKRWRRHAQLRTERWQIKPAAGRRVQQCRAREGRAALIEQQALLVPTELRQIPMKKALVACNEQKHFIANVVLVQNVWRRYMCCKAQLAQQAAVILLQAGARGMLTRNQTQHTRSRNLFACRRVQRRFRAFAASRRSREYPKSSLSASKRNMKTLIRHEAPLSSGTGDQAHGSLRPSIPEFVTVYDHDVDSLSGTLDAKEPTTFQNESPKSYSFGLRSLMAMSILSLAVVLFSHQPSDSTCLAKGCRSVDLSTFSSHSDNDSPASGAKMVELRRYDFEVSVPPLISLTTNELELIKFNVEGSFDKDVPTAACTDPSNNEETIAVIDTASEAVVDSPSVGLEIFESVFASDAAADGLSHKDQRGDKCSNAC